MRISDWSSDVCSSDLRGSRGSMSCREPFMRAVAIADDRRLIFIAAPAAEPELHGQLPAFERLGGFEQQARRGEPATDLRVRKAEARVRRERAQFLVQTGRAHV